MENIKYFIPLITFIVGMFCTPFIESLKDRRTINLHKKNIWTELSDEVITLEKSIKKTDFNITKRKQLSETAVYLSLPAKIEFILLEENLKTVYASLTNEQRLAIKNVLNLKNSINENYDNVMSHYKSSNSSAQSAEESMLYSKLSLYLLLTYLTTSRDNFIRPVLSNDELAVKAAQSLNVKNRPSPSV
ncbi:hypothetical protein IB231_16115 [Pantoea sp. PNT02]|uniref:hypothetical protein n=1 Tax=Pantoea sp. PNT02 TaxID=2769261 RepID=UPI00177E9063|nr:hypothetical protein [Pantoea sp. PNT02]MBD9645149.1 hypothetical protein [Pantoea sp. PNT02]